MEYNNFKLIREVYGATQEELAKALGVNRATVSNWETGATRATGSNLERLSLFYGIGPESFYEVELDSVRRELLIAGAQRQREREHDGIHSKADELHTLFERIPFAELRRRFTFDMKLLLAQADSAPLEDLKMAALLMEKMGRRLDAILHLRQEEEQEKADNNAVTLHDLLSFDE